MDIKKVKQVLKNHGLIAFPTETVMGLGVIYDDYTAYSNLNNVKRRSEDKPYTLMLGRVKDIKKYAYINDIAERIIKKFLPGSITLLLRSKDNVPSFVTHDTGIIGIRIPSIVEICDMINMIGKPLLVPSANRSGEKPAMSSDEVKSIFGNEIGYVVEGKCNSGIPSTILDLAHDDVKIIREGPITIDMVLDALGGK